MEKTWTDQLGNKITIPFPPQRIISVVPSQTELLFDLGLDENIVGVTKFCIHPSEKIKSKTRIGGTKKFNLDLIRELKPDLIIGNKEENYQEGISALQQDFPVWMSDIITLPDAYAMMIALARITDREEMGLGIIEEIKSKFRTIVPKTKSNRVAYLIWKNPYMAGCIGHLYK
jgi:ABC-type Fe3+-hydroxamate transport system substrate-binding protein